MTTVAKNLRLGTAVFAVAAVAVIPPVLAQADETDSGNSTAGTSDSVGSSAGRTPKREARGANARKAAEDARNNAAAGSDNNDSPASTPGAGDPDVSTDIPDSALDVPTGHVPSADASAADATADATPFDGNPLFQNPLWWFGSPNPNPPDQIVTFEFEPLADLPGWTQPMYGWLEGFDFEACVGGVGTVTQGQTVVGPYGTSTSGVSVGCA